MVRRSWITMVIMVALLAPFSAAAASWKMKEMGVGIWDDAAYDTQLRIVEKRNAWSIDELMNRGAFRGRGQQFGAWLVGPPQSTYLNANGVAIYLYKYRLTDPKGVATMFGPSGFYTPGFTTVSLNVSQQPGTWKIEWILHNRETGQDSSIGSQEFQITQAPPPAAASWKMKEMGVGIWDDAAYDTQLRIVENRNTWSISELMNRGAFRGRGQQFGAWLVGPPQSTYLNANGVAIYLYKYRLTDPNGVATMFGPSGFYTPGFTTVSLNVSQQPGTWKIEWILHNRETGQDSPIDSISFTMSP